MYTIVPKVDIPEYKTLPGEPKPLIIDHRASSPSNQNAARNAQDVKELKRSWKRRDVFAESEAKYKHRIEELEKENRELTKAYEPIFQENKILKSHFEHGPDAMKFKRLQKKKNDLANELEVVKEENKLLLDRVKELERALMLEKDYYLEEKWQIARARGRKRREAKEAGLVMQGPFKGVSKPVKRNFVDVQEEDFEKIDDHDAILDTLEKETKILLRKIMLVKQNKDNMDYMKFVGKGALTRNPAIANAVNEKLDRDIETFESRLEQLRRKAKMLKIESIEIGNVNEAKKVKVGSSNSRPSQTSKYFRTKKVQTELEANDDIGQPEESISKKGTENVNDSNKTTQLQEDRAMHAAFSLKSEKASPNRESGSAEIASYNEGNRSHSNLQDGLAGSPKSAEKSISRPTGASKAAESVQTTELKDPNSAKSKTRKVHSPVEDHWDHLAEQLVKTEKNRIMKKARSDQKAQVNKGKDDFKPFEHEPSRPQKRMTSTPKSQIKFFKESPNEPTSPIPALPNTDAADTESIRKPQSASEKNGTENEINQKCKDNIKDISTRLSKKTVPKSPRKTTNTGPAIQYVEKQYSWETFTAPRHNDYIQQSGRYSNGPEPISWRRRSEKDLRSPNKIKPEERLRPISWKSESENRRESAKTNYQETSRIPVNENPGDRKMSEYDLVLADIKRQYHRQAAHLQDKTTVVKSSTLSRVTKNQEEQLPDISQILDFKSNGRAVGKDRKSIMGNSGLRHESLHHLNLL